MKKYLLLILLLIPTIVFAYDINLDDYNKKDLNGILSDVGNNKYIDNTQNVHGKPIYVFYGKECNYSKEFINFYVDKVLPQYKDKVYIVGFETWHDPQNGALGSTILSYKKSNYNGSPLIIIGDRIFEGYTSSYDSQILSAIKNLNDEDIFKSMNSIENRDLDNHTKLYVISILFIILIVAGVIFIFKKK